MKCGASSTTTTTTTIPGKNERKEKKCEKNALSKVLWFKGNIYVETFIFSSLFFILFFF